MNEKEASLLNSKYFKKELVLKGFEKLTDFDGGKRCEYDAHDFSGYFFEDDTAQNQFEKFQELLLSKMGKEYFPIYRMADGEFNFCLNFKPSGFLKFKQEITTCWGEKYTKKEVKLIEYNYINQLKGISEDGMLAIHFME
jgi:hypothetical protein